MLPISAEQTITSHVIPLNKKNQDRWLGNPGSCLGQEQECGGVLYPEFHSYLNKNGK
jgi:hypothetical protein